MFEWLLPWDYARHAIECDEELKNVHAQRELVMETTLLLIEKACERNGRLSAGPSEREILEGIVRARDRFSDARDRQRRAALRAGELSELGLL